MKWAGDSDLGDGKLQATRTTWLEEHSIAG